MPLSLAEIQRLVSWARGGSSARLAYAILAVHADCTGDVFGRVSDIARLTGWTLSNTKRVLAELVELGLIRRKFVGNRWRVTTWHLCAIRDATPPPHAA